MVDKTLYLYKGLWRCYECNGEPVRISSQFVHDLECPSVKQVPLQRKESLDIDNVLKAAIDKWGEPLQIVMAMEELNELCEVS